MQPRNDLYDDSTLLFKIAQYVTFMPTSPEYDAGMRIEPPPPEPDAMGRTAAATAAAEPPDEPPGVRSRFHGFRVVPWSKVRVIASAPNSGAAVLPTITAPAARRRAVWTPSALAMLSL